MQVHGIKAPEGAGQAVCDVDHQRLEQQGVHQPRQTQADEPVAQKGSDTLAIIGARGKVASQQEKEPHASGHRDEVIDAQEDRSKLIGGRVGIHPGTGRAVGHRQVLHHHPTNQQNTQVINKQQSLTLRRCRCRSQQGAACCPREPGCCQFCLRRHGVLLSLPEGFMVVPSPGERQTCKFPTTKQAGHTFP